MSGFFQALPVVLKLEGGLVNDPDDRGGLTNRGVTQETYDGWRIRQSLITRPVSEIEAHEVDAIYHEYWTEGKCDALPWPLSAAHFDSCINHGPKRAARLLQASLRVVIDGQIGPITLGAAETAEPREALEALLWARISFYRRISRGTQLKFLRGWLGRLVHLRDALT